MSREQAIREHSYFIWEREGRPLGRNLEHWLLAEAELRAAPKAANAAEARAQPAVAAKSAPAVRKRAAAKAKG